MGGLAVGFGTPAVRGGSYLFECASGARDSTDESLPVFRGRGGRGSAHWIDPGGVGGGNAGGVLCDKTLDATVVLRDFVPDTFLGTGHFVPRRSAQGQGGGCSLADCGRTDLDSGRQPRLPAGYVSVSDRSRRRVWNVRFGAGLQDTGRPFSAGKHRCETITGGPTSWANGPIRAVGAAPRGSPVLVTVGIASRRT